MTKQFIFRLGAAAILLTGLHMVCLAQDDAPATAEITPTESSGTIPSPSFQDPLLRSAAEHLKNGDWKEARKEADAALKNNKKSSEAWTVIAQSYAHVGLHKKAIRRFKKALKYDPHNAIAYYGRGQSFEKLGRLDEAGNEYQAAFRADPNFEAARNDWKRIKDQITVTE